jgi:hypothetical protein
VFNSITTKPSNAKALLTISRRLAAQVQTGHSRVAPHNAAEYHRQVTTVKRIETALQQAAAR